MISIVIITITFSIQLCCITRVCPFIRCVSEYIFISPLQVCGVSAKRFKYFKAFWTCSFTTPTIKGIYNFSKVRGLIHGFNDSRRQIASGVVKTAIESMIVIRFCTTPKGDSPHYSYIFRNPEPLVTEINNVSFSMLGLCYT